MRYRKSLLSFLVTSVMVSLGAPSFSQSSDGAVPIDEVGPAGPTAGEIQTGVPGLRVVFHVPVIATQAGAALESMDLAQTQSSITLDNPLLDSEYLLTTSLWIGEGTDARMLATTVDSVHNGQLVSGIVPMPSSQGTHGLTEAWRAALMQRFDKGVDGSDSTLALEIRAYTALTRDGSVESAFVDVTTQGYDSCGSTPNRGECNRCCDLNMPSLGICDGIGGAVHGAACGLSHYCGRYSSLCCGVFGTVGGAAARAACVSHINSGHDSCLSSCASRYSHEVTQ